jgi:predicted dehydrogenase
MSQSVLNTPDLRPVIIIGAGGIVNDAHLPAYRLAGFNVKGIYDLDAEKAGLTARRFSIPETYESLDQLLSQAPAGAVFDIAVPANGIVNILEKLPVQAPVLIQKPMGENYDQAKKILQIARDRKLQAAVNFQLRYAPFTNMARNLIDQGLIGELCDIEINVNVYTPWHLWNFLFSSPRVEILYHSIHYIDLVRSFLGNPSGMYAKTVSHPLMKELASVRSNIIMDYGNMIRANILTNHCHRFGPGHQQSYIKFEGTKGAIKIRMGVLINYPAGIPDTLEYTVLAGGKETEWKTATVEGSWFPHAFIGSMAEVMKAAATGAQPNNSVEDCIYTMACVEAAHESDKHGAVKLKP